MKDVVFVKRSRRMKGGISRQTAKERKEGIKKDGDFDLFYYRDRRKRERVYDYAKSIYKANQGFFQGREFTGRAIGTPRTFKAFYDEFRGRKKAFGLSDSEAVLNSVRSRYMSGAEVWRQNAIAALKSSDAGFRKAKDGTMKRITMWDEFREMTKKGGRYQRFDISKLEYNKASDTFSYDGMVNFRFGRSSDKGSALQLTMWKSGEAPR